MNTPQSESITISRRAVGLGTVLIGIFALYHCLSFFGSLWDTPQRTIALVVTISSVLLIYVGVIIGLPDYLPAKIVDFSIFVFGILTTLIGFSILAWVGYNFFVERQAEFRIQSFRQLSFPVLMVAVGTAMAQKSWRKLRKHRIS